MALLSVACSDNDPREVVIVAKGMTFTLPSDPETANPPLRMHPGEVLRVTLRNDAPGLMHDFQIPAWKVKTDQVRGGESTSVLVTVPAAEGRVKYLCGPHGSMMHGVIEVAAR
jgi:plastocyanin